MALLLGLHELVSARYLSLSLVVAHLDHRLRENSRRDALLVSKLAESLGYPGVIGRAEIEKRAAESADNLEQVARKARYDFLARTAARKKSKLVVVAHTMDDQAETVLLRLVRGSGSEGLGAMEAIRPLRQGSTIQIVRPLLSWARRSDTEGFCRRLGVEFALDEMNKDERFARVRVRQQLLPLMESFNKRIVETLSRTASLLREDSSTLSVDATRLLERALEASNAGKSTRSSVNVKVLAAAPPALRRRALRLWLAEGRGDLRRVERVHLLGVERLLEGSKGGRVAELPDGTKVRRVRDRLELLVEKS